MRKNKIKNTERNCKDGLTSFQEHSARQIRKELLDYEKKEKHYIEIRNLWSEFSKNNLDNFNAYVKEKRPELYSAFKRLGISITAIPFNMVKEL